MGMVKTALWLVWSWDSKIDFISEMSRWNKLIFLHDGTNSGKLKVEFWVDLVKIGHGFLVDDSKICCISRMNLRFELIFAENAESDAIIFG